MVILDARGPICEQPVFDPSLLDHVGSHPAMLDQLLANHEFIVDIGQQLAAQWPRQLVEDVDIGVIVFDHSGEHQSVAWSYLILALVLSERYNGRVSEAAMSAAGMAHQGHCRACMTPLSHTIMTKAIVALSLVPHR